MNLGFLCRSILIFIIALLALQYFFFYYYNNNSSGKLVQLQIPTKGVLDLTLIETTITNTKYNENNIVKSDTSSASSMRVNENSLFYIPSFKKKNKRSREDDLQNLTLEEFESLLPKIEVKIPVTTPLDNQETIKSKTTLINDHSSATRQYNSLSSVSQENNQLNAFTNHSKNSSILSSLLNSSKFHSATSGGLVVEKSSNGNELNLSSSPIKSNAKSDNDIEAIKKPCPIRSPLLLGDLKVDFSGVPSTLQELSVIHGQGSTLGGHYSPPNCIAHDRVAIIIPFRDRQEHLRIFLHNIFPMLKRQLIEFNIFVIEQSESSWSGLFNRAMLFNAGFTEASQISGFQFDCYIFHDVDLIPENDKNLYNCPDQPRHMSVAVDKMNYRLPYTRIFGGISALRTEHFKRVNGFSNLFWGWGGEDDDMANRIAYHGLFISRPPPNVARYKMLKHKAQKLNNNRFKILHKGKEYMKNSGLSNLNYTIEQIILEKLFTLIRVKLHK